MATAKLFVATTALVAALGASMAAQDFVPDQQPGPGGQPQGGGGQPQPAVPGLGDGMTPAEIQKLFDAYLIMEAQQALNLTDQQYPQFLARLKALQDTRRRTQQERIQVMGQLQRLTNPRVGARAPPPPPNPRPPMLQEIE